MIKLKKGECHPIFSTKYLAENIASLFEAVFLATEYLLVVFFLLNFFIDVFSIYSMNFVPTLMVNTIANDFFRIFNVKNTWYSNLIALALIVLSYVLTYMYFEFVKYNLHPRVPKQNRQRLQTQK